MQFGDNCGEMNVIFLFLNRDIEFKNEKVNDRKINKIKAKDSPNII